MRRARRSIGVFVVVAVAVGMGPAACGRSGGLTSGSMDALEYDLVQFDTAPVPAALPFGGTILSGRLRLDLDGGCRRSLVMRETAPAAAEVEIVWACQWVRSGDAVTLTWTGTLPGSVLDPAAPTLGTFDGDRVSLAIETGIVCVTTPCPTGWPEVYELRSS